MSAGPRQLERLSTGVPALDLAMGGGLPVQSVSVIAGEPGTGKTVLALATMFAAARAGKKCAYFTTLSEPSLKLMRYMQLFDFFDRRLVDERIAIRDLGTSLRAHEPEAALAVLTEHVEREEPELVIIDSYRAVHDLVPDPSRARAFTYDLAVEMAGWGATTLLVGEYDDEELAKFPELAIADGVIRLGLARQELARVRELEIRKLRGSSFVTGVHFFEIDGSGITFFPRVRAPDHGADAARTRPRTRLSTGVSGLDELLRGGIPEGSSTLVVGGTGTGKTLLGLHFAVEGARRGEPGVILTLEESAEQLRDVADAFGFDLTGLERQGLVHVSYTPPVELSTDRFLDRARELAARVHARRAVLDSLTSLSLGAVSDRRYKELVYALAKHFRRQGVTLCATVESLELLGAARLSAEGLSFAADNVVQLRYVELQGRLDRAMSVVKARGVDLDTHLRPYRIGPHGIELGPAEQFQELRGVLTGLPTPS